MKWSISQSEHACALASTAAKSPLKAITCAHDAHIALKHMAHGAKASQIRV